MTKLLISFFVALFTFTTPANDVQAIELDQATIAPIQQLQSAIANDDIAAASQAFDNNAKFCFWTAKEGTRSQRQVNALNFVLRHFIAGGANKTIASNILTKLDIKTWNTLIAIEDGFEHQAPVEQLNDEMLAEVYQLIKRIHFNSDDDEEAYQQSLRDAAAHDAEQKQVAN